MVVSRLRRLSVCCDPVGIRTQDPQLRRLLLYPTELPDLMVICLLGVQSYKIFFDCQQTVLATMPF